MRDPAFHQRDAFDWDRLELLRGAASMLFARGSTGGSPPGQPAADADHRTRTRADAARRTLHPCDRRQRRPAHHRDEQHHRPPRRGHRQAGIAPTLRRRIGTRHEFSGHPNSFPAGSLWSRCFGIPYQPRPAQSGHLCCGTSFNASGDACQYDAMGSHTPPERSRKRGLGARLDGAGGRYSTRISDALQQRRIVAPRLVSADLLADTCWARTSP